MSRRLGVLVTIRRPANGGVSPNAYVAETTAEVRASWPPLAPLEDVEKAIQDATDKAIRQLRIKRAEFEARCKPVKENVTHLRGHDVSHAYRVTRDLSTSDEEFSSFDLPAGSVVYRYTGATYGVIGHGGVAVSLDGDIPFGQVPLSALEEVEE